MGGPAFVRTTLKNLETGKSLDKTWRAGEAYKEAQVDKLECQYSYEDGDDMVFLNMESFEEERVARSLVDKADYIAEEMEVVVCRWQGMTIDVQVPKTVVVKVAETEPGAKGNTAGGASRRQPSSRRAPRSTCPSSSTSARRSRSTRRKESTSAASARVSSGTSRTLAHATLRHRARGVPAVHVKGNLSRPGPLNVLLS